MAATRESVNNSDIQQPLLGNESGSTQDSLSTPRPSNSFVRVHLPENKAYLDEEDIDYAIDIDIHGPDQSTVTITKPNTQPVLHRVFSAPELHHHDRLPETSRDPITTDNFCKGFWTRAGAVVAALPFATNAFMASVTAISLIDGDRLKSIGDIVDEGVDALPPVTWGISLCVAALASEHVNYFQTLDYLPNLKDDLYSIYATLREGNFSKKKVAMLNGALLSVTSAAAMAYISWSTYESIKNPAIFWPFAISTMGMSFLMTLATRFVRAKNEIMHAPLLHSKEDHTLIHFLLDMEKMSTRKKIENFGVFSTEELEQINIVTKELETLFQHYHKNNEKFTPPRNLEALVMKYYSELKSGPSYGKIAFVGVNTLLLTLAGTLTYAEKLGGLIPDVGTGYAKYIWDAFRILCGALGTLPTTALYLRSAKDFVDNVANAWGHSKIKTVGYALECLISGLSMFYVSYKEANPVIGAASAIIPLPKIDAPFKTGFIAPSLNLLAAGQINFASARRIAIVKKPKERSSTYTIMQINKRIKEEKDVKDELTTSINQRAAHQIQNTHDFFTKPKSNTAKFLEQSKNAIEPKPRESLCKRIFGKRH